MADQLALYLEEHPDDAHSILDKCFTAARAREAARRARDLVKQILTFSRQSPVDKRPIKLQPMVKESLKMLRASLPSTIAIKDNIHSQCGVVLGDASQIHQIVMNLCTNAFHAMEKTGGVLSVSLTSVTHEGASTFGGTSLPPGEYAKLTVSDTGCGIAPDIIDKIFEPYFTTKEQGKGTGMGLAIIDGIVKSYGGAIHVESVLSKGTTFETYFPILQVAEPTIESSKSTVDYEPFRGKERILFVDDEENILEVGQLLLQSLGYSVTVRPGAPEALVAFESTPDQFDLIITDQTMPTMTGIQLAQRLQKTKPGIPVIICTGYSSMIDEGSAAAGGIKGLIPKPYTKESLAMTIRKVLDQG